MAIPSSSIENYTIVERLLAEMPEGFSKDPLSEDMLQFMVIPPLGSTIMENTVTITIFDGKMTIDPQVSYIEPEYLDLEKYTITSFIEYFNAKYPSGSIYGGLSVSRYENSNAFYMYFLASSLLEGGMEISTTQISWPIFTSNNYKLFFSIMLVLKEHKELMKSALAQTDLRVASNEWLNYWGGIFGIPREPSELYRDESYRSRLIRETLMPKSNNWAIADLVQGATGRKCRVVDGGSPFLLVDCTKQAGSDSMLYTQTLATSLGYLTTSGPSVDGAYGELKSIGDGSLKRWFTYTKNVTYANRPDQGITADQWYKAAWEVVPDYREHKATTSFMVFSGQLPNNSVINNPSYATPSLVTVSSVNPYELSPSFNGYITKNAQDNGTYQLHVTALTSAGLLGEGKMISGNYVSWPQLPNGMRILYQISGSAGGAGIYSISAPVTEDIGLLNNLQYPVSFFSGKSFWSDINIISPFINTPDRSAYKIGPLTGVGTFTVYIEPDNGDLISATLYSFVFDMINRYKASGLTFQVKPLK